MFLAKIRTHNCTFMFLFLLSLYFYKIMRLTKNSPILRQQDEGKINDRT